MYKESTPVRGPGLESGRRMRPRARCFRRPILRRWTTTRAASLGTCSAGRTKELRKYKNRADLRPHFDERDMVCTVKQHVWQRFQRPLLQRRIAAGRASYAGTVPLVATIEFDSFRTHPLWRGSEQRANLSIKRAAGGCNSLVRASTPLRSTPSIIAPRHTVVLSWGGP